MAEAGYPGMEAAQIWWSIFGPPNMPKDIVMKMNGAIREALKDPGIQALVAKTGATPAPSTPEEFVDVLQKEKAHLTRFIDRTGIE